MIRKSQRRQRPQVPGRSHRYTATNERGKEDNGDREFSRLERALEIGLEDTFPASDPVDRSITNPTISAASLIASRMSRVMSLSHIADDRVTMIPVQGSQENTAQSRSTDQFQFSRYTRAPRCRKT
jgi:hypothetical protein